MSRPPQSDAVAKADQGIASPGVSDAGTGAWRIADDQHTDFHVPVVDGHTAHVMLRLRQEADSCKVCDVLERYQADHTVTELPSVPCRPLVIHLHYDRPQPRLDAGLHGGMGVSAGRVRRVPGFNLALVVVAHNAVRGATSACLANAELIVSRRSRSSGLAETVEGGI